MSNEDMHSTTAREKKYFEDREKMGPPSSAPKKRKVSVTQSPLEKRQKVRFSTVPSSRIVEATVINTKKEQTATSVMVDNSNDDSEASSSSAEKNKPSSSAELNKPSSSVVVVNKAMVMDTLEIQTRAAFHSLLSSIHHYRSMEGLDGETKESMDLLKAAYQSTRDMLLEYYEK